MKVVVCTHPETGAIITPSASNPEIGAIRVESTQKVFNSTTGFFNNQKRVAFIAGQVSDLEELVAEEKWVEGKEIPGKIVQMESFQPFYEGQDCKRYPESHINAGDPVLTEGRMTYLRRTFTKDLTMQDRFIAESAAVEAAPVQEKQAM